MTVPQNLQVDPAVQQIVVDNYISLIGHIKRLEARLGCET